MPFNEWGCYDRIIDDWKQGKNIQEGLKYIYSDCTIINNEALRLLALAETPTDIANMKTIITLSNILYNNTSSNTLPLEDGVYDLLVAKYKSLTGEDIVGAIPVQFESEPIDSQKTETLVPGVTYLTDDEVKYIREDMLYYNDLYRNKRLSPNDMLVPGVNYEKTITKRLKDTSHNNPELVGTLDKCKFVLMKQAEDKGVDLNDPTVNILERDFFGKHIQAGIIDQNQTLNIIVELKYDGVSVEADIQHQRIISARSRGDTANDLASDLTPILEGYYFPDLPDTDNIIPAKFEAIMTYENLAIYSQLKGKTFANGRTAIISWFGSSDAYMYRDLVTLVPLATGIKDAVGKPINIYDRLVEVDFINRYLCRGELLRYSVFCGNYVSVLYQIYKFAKEAEFMRKFLPFMYDGIVVSYLDGELREKLGRKNSVNLYSMAVKFNSLKRLTRFVEYQYTIGQNGEITPMIYYNPVEFFGTIHPKSSGHSYGNFKELSLRINDIIEVEYRNDVITYVTKVDCIENDNNPNPVIEFPNKCPCCGTELVFTENSAKCPNMHCYERSVKRMANMLDKLQITGFGEETVRALGITSFHELMELKLEDISYIGDLTSKSLIDQLNNLRNSNVPEYKLIGSLGFTDIAINTWKLIFSNISLDDFVCGMELYDKGYFDIWDDLLAIKGIGEKILHTIVSEYEYFFNDIVYIIKNIKYQKSKGIKQIKVRFTGVRNQELVNALNQMGYDAGEGSVTKDTDILIIPYSGYNTGSKYSKAIKYGIRIVPIETFITELGLNL